MFHSGWFAYLGMQGIVERRGFDVLADVIGRELGAANWGQVRIDFEKYQRRVA